MAAVLALLFGATALGIAGQGHALAPDQRAGWLLTGIGFLAFGSTGLVQDVGAVTAFVLGEGTVAWDAYLRWAPPLNHSRIAAGIALGAALARVAWDGGFPTRRAWVRLVAALVAAMLAGAGLGVMEGSFDVRTHGLAAAIGITLELIAFAVALLVSAVRGTLDVFLFTALTFYAANLALNVPLLSAMSLVGASGGHRPPPWLLQLQPVIFESLMLGVAVFRLTLVRRGLRVRDVLGRDRAPRLPPGVPGGAAGAVRPPRLPPGRT